MNHKTIYDFLSAHVTTNATSFHMPGHKGGDIYRRLGYGDFLDKIIDMDVTEIHGADNLFKCESIIKQTQENYADLYNVNKSYLLINGSSAGIIAAILTAVNKGEKLIVARNSHKAIYNAINMGGIKPVYVFPEEVENFGIVGAIDPETIAKKIKEHPDAKAIMIPSPNYYGICSNIQKIADLAHQNNMILIVDEAHGAHLKFFNDTGYKEEMPESAVASEPESKSNVASEAESKSSIAGELAPGANTDQRADLVINSTHKTLASLTQSAVIHVCSDRIDTDRLEYHLQSIESTSPSYILMCSLDINEKLIRGHKEELFENWMNNLNAFYESTKDIPGIDIMYDVEGLDLTKINICVRSFYANIDKSSPNQPKAPNENAKLTQLDGHNLEDLLRERYGIFTELTTGNVVMCMTGIGNKKEDYELLAKALKELSAEFYKDEPNTGPSDISSFYNDEPQFKEVPTWTEKIDLNKSSGRICGEMIIPYPPGIPILCPGEVITDKYIDYINKLIKEDHKVMGVKEGNKVVVGLR